MLKNRRIKYVITCIAVLLVLFLGGGWVASLFTDPNDYSYITITFSPGGATGTSSSVRVNRFNGSRNNASVQYFLTQDDEVLNYYMEGHNFFRWRLEGGDEDDTFFAGQILPSGFYNDITLVAEWGEWTTGFSWEGTGSSRKLVFDDTDENGDPRNTEAIHIPAELGEYYVTEIPANFFKNNEVRNYVKYISVPTKATSVAKTFPGVSNIRADAFSGCENLEWTNIPYSVGAPNSSGVLIGSAVISAYDSTFKIQHISVSANSTIYTYNQGVLFDKTKKSLIKMFVNMQKFIVPEGVENIGVNAFDTSNLISITLPSTLKTIGTNAFINSAYLEKITIPKGVTEIPAGVFEGCTGLNQVTFIAPTEPDKYVTVRAGAFRGCTALKSLILHDRFENIEPRAFEGSGLEKIYIPEIVYDNGEYKRQSDLTNLSPGWQGGAEVVKL